MVEYKGFLYQAASWKTARRVVAKVEPSCGRVVPARGFHCDGPDPAESSGRSVLQQTGHGRAVDQRRQAGSEDDAAELSSVPVERGALWLSIIAYNLGNLWRRLVLPQRIGNWSLTSLQQRLVKTGGRLVKHARYYWLLLAESHLTRGLFGSMLRRIAGLSLPAG